MWDDPRCEQTRTVTALSKTECEIRKSMWRSPSVSPHVWLLMCLVALLGVMDSHALLNRPAVGALAAEKATNRGRGRTISQLRKTLVLRGGYDASEPEEDERSRGGGTEQRSKWRTSSMLSSIVASLKKGLQSTIQAVMPKKRELQITMETFMQVCDEIEALLP